MAWLETHQQPKSHRSFACSLCAYLALFPWMPRIPMTTDNSSFTLSSIVQPAGMSMTLKMSTPKCPQRDGILPSYLKLRALETDRLDSVFQSQSHCHLLPFGPHSCTGNHNPLICSLHTSIVSLAHVKMFPLSLAFAPSVPDH